jgi:hypothetical protein
MNQNITSFEAHLTVKYGEIGTPKRETFENQSLNFRIFELEKVKLKKKKLFFRKKSD